MEQIFKDKKYYKDNSDFDNYHKLPIQTSQQILKDLTKSWKSYLVSRSDYLKNPEKYIGKPKEPGYKKKDGESQRGK